MGTASCVCNITVIGTGLGGQKPDYPHIPVGKPQVYPKPPFFLKIKNLFIFKFAYHFKDCPVI